MRTAYEIAEYVKAKADEDSEKIGIDLDKTNHKQRAIKKLIVRIVADKELSVKEYYDLFAVDGHRCL